MRRIAKSLLWKWRRRHAAERIRLQRLILGSADLFGIDVGAAEGLQPHWWAFEGVARMYLFEPHEESANKLRALYATSPYERMFHVIPVGLGATSGIRDFYMLNAPTGSSLYPIDPSSEFAGPDNRYVHPIRTAKVQVRRLSEVLDEHGVPRVDIAKLDVQGAELEVLQGLDDRRFASLVLVEAEVNISGGISKTTSPYVGVPHLGRAGRVSPVSWDALTGLERVSQPSHKRGGQRLVSARSLQYVRKQSGSFCGCVGSGRGLRARLSIAHRGAMTLPPLGGW